MTLTAQQLFEKSGAVLNGHFLLTSGLHSPIYWEKFQVLQYPEYTQQLCGMIAERFRRSKYPGGSRSHHRRRDIGL